MKNQILSAAFIATTLLSATAQTSSYQLNVELKNGTNYNVDLNDIEKITFVETSTPPAEITDFSFVVPSKWTNSYVMKVMNGNTQIAEVCNEYIKSVDKQMIVAYPMGEDGKADLTKGVSSTGATVVWDLTANTATVGTEGDAVATMYVVDGAIVTATDKQTNEATVTPDRLIDARGSEVISYSIVKIATQYWMAESLRATKYADGSAITAYSQSQATQWAADTSGCYLSDSGQADWTAVAGRLYSGYCVTNEAGIAPQGWSVPTQQELTQLRSAGNLKAANFRSTETLAWVINSTAGNSNNKTGFSAYAAGNFAPSASVGYEKEGAEVWFWSSTKYYDAFSKGDNLDTLRITNNITGNIVVSSSSLGGHILTFGHCIRCIRK